MPALLRGMGVMMPRVIVGSCLFEGEEQDMQSRRRSPAQLLSEQGSVIMTIFDISATTRPHSYRTRNTLHGRPYEVVMEDYIRRA